MCRAMSEEFLGDDLIQDLSRITPPDEGPEMIIGFVSPVGVPLGDIEYELEQALDTRGYSTETISLSDIICEYHPEISPGSASERPEDERIRKLQEAGNNLRERSGRNDALAILACMEIRELREGKSGHNLRQSSQTAYLLRSLKTPKEVETLRRIYGDGFILVSAYSPPNIRQEELAAEITEDELGIKRYEPGENEEIDERARSIIEIDKFEENESHGQNVRDTFPLGDIFLDASQDNLDEQIDRAVDVLFGDPFRTPTIEEQSMYIAVAARWRSAALGRQVGAVLTDEDGNLISVGCNEVPRAGGGLYWPEENEDQDLRDFQLGRNLSKEKRVKTVAEIVRRFNELGAMDPEDWGISEAALQNPNSEELQPLLDDLDGTRVSSLIEFYRETHAEMEAILSAARRGSSVKDAALYSTTFPCHECTRHIVAAGIERVVYIEPYPKSLGPELHGDSVEVRGRSPSHEIWKSKGLPSEEKVKFEPFVGVGPRIFEQVFRGRERKDGHGDPVDWPHENPTPVFAVDNPGFWINEILEIAELHAGSDGFN